MQKLLALDPDVVHSVECRPAEKLLIYLHPRLEPSDSPPLGLICNCAGCYESLMLLRAGSTSALSSLARERL
eukprot:5332447-Amphidinium_carterae.1